MFQIYNHKRYNDIITHQAYLYLDIISRVHLITNLVEISNFIEHKRDYYMDPLFNMIMIPY